MDFPSCNRDPNCEVSMLRNDNIYIFICTLQHKLPRVDSQYPDTRALEMQMDF
jgi:hypothetical protein